MTNNMILNTSLLRDSMITAGQIQGLARASRHRSAHARRSRRPVAADHPAHGSKRRRDPRQCRFADEAVAALDALGIELISDNAASQRRRPRRAAEEARAVTLTIALACAAALLALAVLAVIIGRVAAATRIVYGASLIITAISLVAALRICSAPRRRFDHHAAARRAMARRAFPSRRAVGLLPRRGRSRRRRREPVRARLRRARNRRRSACCRSIRPFSPA